MPAKEGNRMNASARAPKGRLRARWRVVDIVVAAVIAVVGGVVFWAWDLAYEAPSGLLEAAVPGLSGLVSALWLFIGVLGAVIIRKPGAALFTELVAAVLSMVLGAQYGVDTLVSGIAQGLGAEIVFALFLYRRFGLGVAVLAGAAAGALETIHELIVWYSDAAPGWQTIYSVSLIVAGGIAGVIGWALARGLAATGVLDRFAAGRTRPRSA